MSKRIWGGGEVRRTHVAKEYPPFRLRNRRRNASILALETELEITYLAFSLLEIFEMKLRTESAGRRVGSGETVVERCRGWPRLSKASTILASCFSGLVLRFPRTEAWESFVALSRMVISWVSACVLAVHGHCLSLPSCTFLQFVLFVLFRLQRCQKAEESLLSDTFL